jgi:hypothetical protein
LVALGQIEQVGDFVEDVRDLCIFHGVPTVPTARRTRLSHRGKWRAAPAVGPHPSTKSCLCPGVGGAATGRPGGRACRIYAPNIVPAEGGSRGSLQGQAPAPPGPGPSAGPRATAGAVRPPAPSRLPRVVEVGSADG